MSNAEYDGLSAQPRFFQRISTPLFVLLSLIIVPIGTSVSLLVGAIICDITGTDHSDTAAWIGLAALAIGFVGSIYLLFRARRSSIRNPGKHGVVAPPPLSIRASHAQRDSVNHDGVQNGRGGAAPSYTVPQAADPAGRAVNDLGIPAHMKADSIKVPARIAQLFLFSGGQPVAAEHILGIHSHSNHLLLVTRYTGTFSPRPSEGITLDLRTDVLCAAVVNERSTTKTAVGKTIGRMALSGLAAKLLTGGEHAGLGGAVLDYRIAGAETRTDVHTELLIVLNDLTAIVLDCDEKLFKRMLEAIPADCFDRDADAIMNEYDLISRMADDGDRIYPELQGSIDGLCTEIDALRHEESAGKTFAERDSAKTRRKSLEQQVQSETARFNAVRYLIESRNALQPPRIPG